MSINTSHINIAFALAQFHIGPWYRFEDGIMDYEHLVVNDGYSKPSEVEVEAEVERLQTEYDNNQYQRDRQYPSIGDQLDMIYHAGLGGDEFQAAIKAVKDAHPKPK